MYFGWMGGGELLRYLANGLLAIHGEKPVRLFLLLPKQYLKATPQDFLRLIKWSVNASLREKRILLATSKALYDNSILDYFENISGHVETVYHANTAAGFFDCLKNIDADVILPVGGTLGPDYPIPWVGYAPDFQ